MDGEIAGFAIRSAEIDPSWDQARRQAFLLDPNVESPRSVDSNVWADALACMGTGPDGVRFPFPSWSDQELMLSAALERGVKGVEAVFMVHRDFVDLQFFNLDSIRPSATDLSRYQFLGYDVADCGLLSALSNCAYDSSESIRNAREMFASELNSAGLFRSLEFASRFAKYSDARVEDHAPFYVFGVYARPTD